MKTEENRIDSRNAYLDTEHIRLSDECIEYHPLKPFLPAACRVLFLGSFPPQRKKWAKDFCFFYPNFINDHWRIEGEIFFGDKDYFVDATRKTFLLDKIVRFLEEKGIGFYDTATAVKRLRDNASDKYLEVVERTNIADMLKRLPACKVVVATGEKAARTICESLGMSQAPSMGHFVELQDDVFAQRGLVVYRLPSSSRAYPLSLEKKVEAYRKMFELAGILH